jgi:hypothetical protein
MRAYFDHTRAEPQQPSVEERPELVRREKSSRNVNKNQTEKDRVAGWQRPDRKRVRPLRFRLPLPFGNAFGESLDPPNRARPINRAA